MSWTGVAPAVFTQIDAGNKILLASFALSGAFDETVTRVRGLIQFQSDQGIAAEFQLGAVGMIVVSSDALAVGITALPSPGNDITNDGWFVWVPLLNTVGAADASANPGYRIVVDSKAQRIVHEGSVIVVVAENFGASGLQLAFNFRMLSRFRS